MTAAATDPETRATAVIAQARGAADLLRALAECGDALRTHALALIGVLLDPDTDDDDRFLTAATLADVLYPAPPGADGTPGVDLAAADPDDAAALADMDREEATFAAALAEAMAARGVSQSELAKRVGIGQPAISMMLARECRPQKRTVRRLADGLGMTPAELWPNFDGGS